MKSSPDKLLALAQDGTKLTTQERRHVVAFLMATQPEMSNVEEARIFGVSERTIRDDKQYIREDRAKLVREEDVGLVIGDIAANFDRQIRDIESSKRKCKMGSRTYLEHCRSIFKMELDKVSSLQGLGFYPKNLGTMTTQKFEFTASVGVMDDGGKTLPAQVEQSRDMDVLDAEFSDVVDTKLLEPPKSEALTQ